MTSLGITCGQIRREVGRHLGFDRNPANWNANEIQDVWDLMDAGLRQFYRPPRLPGEHMAHQWAFLLPQMSLVLQPDTEDYLLPDDFAGISGSIYFVRDDTSTCPITVVNEARILQLRQSNWYENSSETPKIAAITPQPGDGINQQRYQLQIWPRPDEAYTLRFKYFARQQPMRSDDSVPLGGSEHAETIRLSCLAAAEAYLDDEPGGRYYQMFLEQLRASVDFDRRATSPGNIGYNGDRSIGSSMTEPGYIRSSRLTTYEKYPE